MLETGNRAVFLYLALLIGLSLAAPPVLGRERRIRDLTPDYSAFLTKAQRNPGDAQALWTRYYFLPNAALFRDVQCPGLASGKLARQDLADLLSLAPRMKEASTGLRHDLPEALARFEQTFPDNRWHGDIYIMVSLGCFDGRAQRIGGKPAMLLGTDVIARTGNTQPTVLLTHELFHLYHRQFFEPKGDPLWASLWTEGLATYASEALNPGATLEAMLLPTAMTQAVDRDRARLAAALSSHLDESGGRAETLYFRTDDRTEPVPPRSGYYLGLLTVRSLAEDGHTLKEMAHWDAATAEKHLRRALLDVEIAG